jgi:hypothetical protein
LSSVELTFDGIKNPRTFKPSDSFKIKTYDTDGVSIIDEGFNKNVVMNIAGVITEFILERQSTVNGFVNDYTFTVKTDIPLISGDVLKFTFPDEITTNDAGSGNSQCVSTDTIKCSNTDHEF